ncbi:DEKNAAC102996 [Brettanomyces naardenensis]|uniref:DEKNAAC102996 n=1 Tax=Brettanomyces naardenensis TaxID=13370 RepID=A0A448YM21_BRENA|nr:DEKNAAC102996 [Brettanomyces naardenensis]
MSNVNFDPESPYGQQLKTQIASKLEGLNLSEDPEYVAEFLLVLISNNRTPDEILHEFNALFGDAVDGNFINEVVNEVRNPQQQRGEQQQQEQLQQQQQEQEQQEQEQLQQQQQQQLQLQQQQEQQQQQLQQSTQQQSLPEPQQPQSAFQPSAFQGSFQPSSAFQPSFVRSLPSSIPKAPVHQQVRFEESGSLPMEDIRGTPAVGGADQITSSFNRFNAKAHGISKGGNFKNKKSFAMRNEQNFQDLMNKSLNSTGPQTTHFVPKKTLGRCKHFPHCRDRNCRYAHPTKMCFAFPNCPNPPGTCNYLHPGEDDALIEELEKVKQERFAQKLERNNNMIKQVSKQVEQRLLQQTNGIALCKFGSVCQRELCPFGHPTPANKDAKVLVLEWCPANKSCVDPNCVKAHSSPNYKAPEKTIGGGAGAPATSGAAVEKTLEQCKFGKRCKNFRCPKRHATTTVLCRDGANCTRIDCYFQHPIDEDCKFGANCKNPNCPFKHPEGRQLNNGGRNMVWVNQEQDGSKSATDQRQFAVPEDQVMEQAPLQEA